MVEIEKYKVVFGEVEFERVRALFPTFIMILDVVIGENKQITKELKFLALQQAKIYSQTEYQEYRIINPLDTASRSLYLSYRHWIDSNFNALTKLDNENKLPSLKTAKGNKDLLLNQEQLVILFQYLQKINIFDSAQKLNTKMSKALNLLTGWDENKMRILFSENKDSNDSTHKGKVINTVKKLLSSLEQEK